ncbi:SipW-dependent-type signal peptide-containing protein [Halobacterium litoreum]|uniref:SipW-dependent-type signal peptide-containing protein n=1 Tax=Halobacterium litoreum TaxID=2039234 RepID=A0ABD5ND32_9EURY|nr:SipW-dependent-type signal peptide-containing protein [Halobacterium litoreum]UHH14242.1 CalY family protein [Halobacterium litoreum]
MRDTPKLTRRRLLASVGTIGAGLGVAGTGTMALLSDEESSEDNSVTAGTLDLELGWVKYYHGRESRESTRRPDNGDGPIFQIGDLKPGDCGGGVIGIHVEDNPAYVWATVDVTDNAENGLEEPEEEAPGEDGKPVGELADEIQTVVKPHTYLAGSATLESESEQFVREDCPDEDDFEQDECYFIGSFAGLADAAEDGYLLDGGYGAFNSETQDFTAGSVYLINFHWWLPESVGNQIQGDELTFSLSFGAVQSRHVDTPENHNPFAGD